MLHSQGRFGATAMSGFGPDAVLYCPMPLFRGNALNAILFPALTGGARIVLRDRFSATSWLDDVRRHGVTFTATVGRALGYVLTTAPSDHHRDHRLRAVLAPEASPRYQGVRRAARGARAGRLRVQRGRRHPDAVA